MLNLPFLEKTTPPPFYQQNLSDEKRLALDKAFLGNRSQSYYLRQFAKIDKAGRLIPTWNWAAFVATFAWLLYRKRYLDCLVYCVAGWSFIKVNIVLILVASEFVWIHRLPDHWQMSVRIGLGVAIWLFWAINVGRWANAYYYRMARREIADALELYRSDTQAIDEHLKLHGGVSLLGMGMAFGVFFVILGIFAVQFLPLISQAKEKALIDESFAQVYQAQLRVENIYQNQGCPVGLPLSASSQKSTMQVVNKVAGVATDCAVVLTVNKAHYPVRYLNGQTLVMYRTPKGVWRCQTSLNKAKTPKRCVG